MIRVDTDRCVRLPGRHTYLVATAFLVLGIVGCHKPSQSGSVARAPTAAEPPAANASNAVAPSDAISRTIDACGGKLHNGLSLRRPGITNVMVEFSSPLSAAVIQGKGMDPQDFTKDTPFANLRIEDTKLDVLEAACKDPDVRVLEVLTEFDPTRN